VSALAQGKAGDAVRELETAVALAPDFILARYNLACPRAKSGDHAGARADLDAVFAADFVGMRAQAEKDGDLKDFWKSEPGKELAAHTPALEARYESVLARGLRAILWRDGSSQHRGSVKPAMVRVGVFDTETMRFVPVAPPVPRAFFGFTSSTIPFAVVATGAVRDTLGGDMDAGKVLERIYAYPISTKGVPSADVTVNVEPYAGNLRIGKAGLFLDACQSAGSLGSDPQGADYCASFELRFGGLVTKKLHTPATHPTSSTIAPGEPSAAIVLGYNHWGYVVTETAPSYAYKSFELALPSGAKVAVPKNAAFYRAPPREIVPSPTGDRIVLVWNAAVLVCDPAQDIPGRFKLLLLDVASGRVTQLGEGDGAGVRDVPRRRRALRTEGTARLPRRAQRNADRAPGGRSPRATARARRRMWVLSSRFRGRHAWCRRDGGSRTQRRASLTRAAAGWYVSTGNCAGRCASFCRDRCSRDRC
jgi:hypothetical protein